MGDLWVWPNTSVDVIMSQFQRVGYQWKNVNLAVFHNPLVDLPVLIAVQLGNIDKMLCDSGVWLFLGRHYKCLFITDQMILLKPRLVKHSVVWVEDFLCHHKPHRSMGDTHEHYIPGALFRSCEQLDLSEGLFSLESRNRVTSRSFVFFICFIYFLSLPLHFFF